MFNCAASLLHLPGRDVPPVLHGVEHAFMLPAPHTPFLASRALRFEFAVSFLQLRTGINAPRPSLEYTAKGFSHSLAPKQNYRNCECGRFDEVAVCSVTYLYCEAGRKIHIESRMELPNALSLEKPVK